MDGGARQGYNPWGHKEPDTIEKWEGKTDCFSITILFWFFHLAPAFANTITLVLPSKLGSLRKSVTASLPFKVGREGIPWQSSG